MHVIVSLCMMTWSNTFGLFLWMCLICFVLFYCLILWMYFSMCLLLSDVYWHVPYSDTSDAETGSVECVCVYVWHTRKIGSSMSPLWELQISYHTFNPLNAELNPICHLLALLGAHHILHVSRIRVKMHHFKTGCDLVINNTITLSVTISLTWQTSCILIL
jgi:hypothetical protein